MKNPNGWGTVAKLSGNRRRPFVVKEGKTGRQKIIGYAATREEGMILLAKYNNLPWNIDASRVTLQELYDLWLEKRAVKLGDANRKSLKSAYRHCISLSKMEYSQIKSYQMQDCIDDCERSASTQRFIKNLWNHLDKFALELDIASKQYSSLLTTDPAPETSRTVFTEEEIQRLWDNQHLSWVDSILFLLYTGFRISEALGLKTDDINLEEGTMQGGVKTAAGKNRIVPIHSKIRHIVEKRFLSSKQGYLFEYEGLRSKDTVYRKKIWHKLMSSLDMKHTPHECRHTFRSRLDSAGANKVCIDRIMGHKSGDTGERVYTHKTIKELKEAIEMIN